MTPGSRLTIGCAALAFALSAASGVRAEPPATGKSPAAAQSDTGAERGEAEPMPEAARPVVPMPKGCPYRDGKLELIV